MKQRLIFLALSGAILLAGCGGNGDTTSQSTFNNGSGNQPFKPTTHLSHRSVVSNYFAGQLQVMDTTQDRLTTFSFATGSQPTYIQPSPDGTLTFVNNTGSNSISSLNNNLEAVKAVINLAGATDSFVTSVSNKFGFAAVPNYSNGTFRTPGAIVRFNPTDGSLNTQIQFPNVHYIAMDVAEKHLLAFTDNQNIPAHWVDLTATDPKTELPPIYDLTLNDASGVPVALSNPVDAFFSADSSKAYILSCGLECGGASNPSVTEIDASTLALTLSTQAGVPNTGTATVVKQWMVNGARRGLIDLAANKLYVAGSVTTTASNDCLFPALSTCSPTNNSGHNVQDGYFTTIDLAAGSAGPAIRIGNGAKRWIRNIKGVFWVASLNCGVQSCITQVNPATGTATVFATARGDATGISLAVNSGRVYTIEGGELYIYDQSGNLFASQYNTDVKGQASDVLYIN